MLDDTVLGKPGDEQNTVRQLVRAAGRRVQFLTSVCLLNTRTGNLQLDVVPCSVTFRKLTAGQIARYVRREKPFDCAGGFKSEGLGVALLERMEGDDPTALVGLPLIRLTGMLQGEGIDILMGLEDPP